MSGQVVIRKAGIEDVESIASFNIKMAIETEDKKLNKNLVMRGVKAVIKDSNKGFYLIAEQIAEQKRTVGQLLITFEWSDWRNKYFWWIQSVYVDKNFRNRKVLSQLYRRVTAMAEESKEVCGFRLYVEKHNRQAKKVYESLGMVKTPYEVYEKMN
jgi:ribosomal protein S18 acetylase RimI-like enzyme